MPIKKQTAAKSSSTKSANRSPELLSDRAEMHNNKRKTKTERL